MFGGRIAWMAAAAATVVIAVPQLAYAADYNATIRDVQLGAHGTLRGQVVSSAGVPQAGVPVLVSRNGRLVASVASDGRGEFTVSGLQGGLYVMVAGQQAVACRAWSAGTAPPSAQPSLLLVSEDTVQRGQFGGGLLTNPWIVAALVAATLAITLGLSDDAEPAS